MLKPGHIEGHTAYMLRSRGKKLTIVGETLASGSSVIRHPEWVVVSDTNVIIVVRTRYDLIDKYADEKSQILSYHEEIPGMGLIVRDRTLLDFFTVARVA